MDEVLKDLREEIKDIDREIIALLDERFDLCWEIGGYKKEHNIPIQDKNVEDKKLKDIEYNASEENSAYIQEVYKKIFEQSRNMQNEI